MNLWTRTLKIALTAFSLMAFTVVFTSCEKDACEVTHCENGGSCGDGVCHCPTGYEGTVCEYKSMDKFLGKYYGSVRCGNGGANLVDTAYIWFKADPNQVYIIRHSNITDTISATVVGSTLYVPPVENDNTAKYVSANYNSGHLIFHTSLVTDMANNVKTTCTFEGMKRDLK